MTTRYRGETIRISITAKINGAVINLDEYDQILLRLYYRNRVRLQYFSMEADEELEDYDSDNFEVIDAEAGRFDVILQKSVTDVAEMHEVRCEIEYQKEDPDMEDEIERTIQSDLECFRFAEAAP